MGLGPARLAWAWIAMLLALFFAAPASATTLPPSCHAFSLETTTYSELARQPERWICHSIHWTDERPVGWLRFDASSWQSIDSPKSFITRISKFEQLDVFAVNSDGTIDVLALKQDDVKPLAGGSIFSTPLPGITDDTQAIVIRIVRPWNAALLAEGRLSTVAGGEGWHAGKLALVAILIGLLLAPMIYDLAVYMVIAQRFVLWHAVLTLSMAAYVASMTGLSSLFFDMSVMTHAILNGITIAVAVAAAAFFTADYLEPQMLSHRMRWTLRLAGAIVLTVSGTVSFFPPFLNYTAQTYFFLGFLPPFAVLFAAMAQALRRGSRAAKFQIVAWTPIILCGLERIPRGLGLYGVPEFVDSLLYFTLVAEVVISVLGVADRMMSFKQQRDRARTEIRMLTNLAEHDHLTGLYNRRAIEPRFTALCEEGFTTFALIDLDHFKGVNDKYGHATGDAVLRAVAEALAPDDNTLAMRLGGEEFLLLLRGRKARQRAEQRRQALPHHIATRVPGLAGPVTASMGLIEGAIETMEAKTFNDLYARADKLLYEAKLGGRNRTIGEKLTLFSPRRTERRRESDRRRAA
ncbi:hypothetical protein MB02_08445 [Croceicoccus estronivorus]|uniref:sensor domain-containing diguanylate cyclase n=1 Tax=Croceicoccus estronivorus TaxID=1172626 RepID=UPI000830FE7E|nr:diguanylate cyclase [Croceicoccus estronivorus]OCC23851.1 hypothetical protein MB02_08445 [Croceicoccus estronivorus]